MEENASEKFNEASCMRETEKSISSSRLTPSILNERIMDFYRQRIILITGGTGFVGKVLIQKLLSCFDLGKIYILIRCKNDVTVKERLQQFLSAPIFNRLRDERPELLDKVHAIHVNFNAHDLDINDTDRKLLYDDVEIVFNVLASVKFNEKLSCAININVIGTKKILDLALKMPKLKAFLHVSTLYSNCNRQSIQEKVYDTDIDYLNILKMYRIFDGDTLEKFRSCLLGDMPNSYTMTKKCSENLINHQAAHIPAGIFRPPIIISTYKEPFPGWTDNLYGPSGLCVWSARGLVHCIYGNRTHKANLVPADYCVNAIIASAWDVAQRYALSRINGTPRYEVPVYNYIFEQNNLTWSQYMHLAREGFHEPFDKALWCFAYTIIPYRSVYHAASFLMHLIPAYLLDLIAAITGEKCIYRRMYRKIMDTMDLMSWFGLRQWTFSNNNIDQLAKMLNAEERALLEFHMDTINWPDYFRAYLSGIRHYYFKDNENGYKLEQRRRVYRRMLYLHRFLKMIFNIFLGIYSIKMLKGLYKLKAKDQ